MKRYFILSVLTFVCCFRVFAQVQAPSNLESFDIDDISASLQWNQVANTDYYEIQYWVALSEEVSTLTTEENSVQIMGLISGTQYLWKVRVVDMNSEISPWSETSSFYTQGFSTDCAEITNLVVGDMNNNRLLLQWDSEQEVTQWEVVMDEIGGNPFNSGVRYTTSNYEYPFSSLSPSHLYQFAVRSLCLPSVSNWKYIYARYLNENSVRNFPIQLDFEDSTSNSYVGLISSPVNPWRIGSADNEESVGGNAMYISNDNGESVSFSNSNSAISYSYIDFFVPEEAVSFYIDFKYKATLHDDNAGMKVYLLSAGTPLSINSLPEENYLIGASLYGNTDGEWVQEHIELPIAFIGEEKRIAFVWFNNEDSQQGTPIALDNIYLTARYCAVPNNLTDNYTAATSTMLSWNITANQSSFHLQYKKADEQEWTLVENVENNYLLYNLEPDTYYVFRVKADCITEESFYSEIDTFKTSVLANIPQNLTYEVTDNTATISWDEDATNQYFIVNYKPNSINASWVSDTAENNFKFLSNLSQNTEYLFRVAGVNYYGDTSNWSDTVIFSTLCTPIHTFPYNINYVLDYNDISGYVNVPNCWSANDNSLYSVTFDLNEVTAPLLKFSYLCNTMATLSISTDGGENFTILDYNLQSENFTERVYSLNSYTYSSNVVLRFECMQNHDITSMLRISNFTIEESCPVANNINVDSLSSDYIAVSWDNNNNMVNSWKVFLKQDGETIESVTSSVNHHVFNNLSANTQYTIVLYSVCSGELSLDSITTNISTVDYISCSVPADFTAYWWQTKGEQTLYAQWSNEDGTNVWQVVYKDYYALQWDTAQVTITPIFTLRNLDMGTCWVIKVRSICSPTDTSDFTAIDTVFIGNSGIDEINNEIYLNVYPNPANDVVNIDYDFKTAGNYTLFITDSFGKERYRQTLQSISGKETINLNNFAVGTYYYNIRQDNKPVKTGKIVVAR
ncbi:MAG: fibronectin type III domain-containing protein [Bacteroidales bacterium]|nr:fibronectin type III domain-containing protein [Bacteroidales bacterium]